MTASEFPPTSDPAAPPADAWDAFVEASDPGSYLQLGGWATVKAVNGWSAQRLDEPGVSAMTTRSMRRYFSPSPVGGRVP